MAFSINIIGAGHLGKTIGYLLVKHQLVNIGAICNRSEISSFEAIKFIGEGKYYPKIGELPPADITFITTPDDLISITCEELSKNKFIKPKSIVLHCSGSLTSNVLISMKEKNCYVASIHPMRSFAKPELCIEEYSGTYCAIEGDEEAISKICPLFNSIGSMIYEIDKRKKSLYHAAGVFASNYLVTLSQQALTCMMEAGVENEIAMRVITSIMRGTVSNLEKTLSPQQSLTGPIQRGDVSTIKNHVESLTDIDKKNLYITLARATLTLTENNKTKKEKIKMALSL